MKQIGCRRAIFDALVARANLVFPAMDLKATKRFECVGMAPGGPLEAPVNCEPPAFSLAAGLGSRLHSIVVVIALLLGMLASTTAWSQDFAQFTQHPTEMTVAVLEGPIDSGILERFRDFARPRQILTLVLNSPGGDLVAAANLAETISDLGIATVIPEQAECASACALIFFAGAERSLRGRLGVHQFWTPGQITPSETSIQDRVGWLQELFLKFEVPGAVSVHFLRTPPDCMYWYDGTQSRQFERSIDDRPNEPIVGTIDCGPARTFTDGHPESSPGFSPEGAVMEIQRELERHGCSPGMVDGVIGPNSRTALARFAHSVGLDLSFDHFVSAELLSFMRSIERPACRPSISGIWYLTATCSGVRGSVTGLFEARAVGEQSFAIDYQNNLRERAQGLLELSGFDGEMVLFWSNGFTTDNVITIGPDASTMEGRASNGCSYSARRQ